MIGIVEGHAGKDKEKWKFHLISFENAVYQQFNLSAQNKIVVYQLMPGGEIVKWKCGLSAIQSFSSKIEIVVYQLMPGGEIVKWKCGLSEIQSFSSKQNCGEAAENKLWLNS